MRPVLSFVIAAILIIISGFGYFCPPATAGPAAFGICQAGCAGAAMACYSAAGFAIRAAPLSPIKTGLLNSAQGACCSTCAALLFRPTAST
ncbi:hypothetical protein LSUE1_G003862 [Lachnellula suecica]|uniref:Uncharacterized protein n=1 Tax=Lachnellula suecica TaxID=602035 RepID=A0A8T9C6Q9_9HELO|nr:hypothetical protein LSUE1_G003862 [Lachnellula suecica]